MYTNETRARIDNEQIQKQKIESLGRLVFYFIPSLDQIAICNVKTL